MYPYNLNIPYNTRNKIPYISTPNITLSSPIPIFKNKMNLFPGLSYKLNTLKNVNWSNIINNTSKTLGVINQAIPIVKQTKPMLHNMRSMLKVASAFRDETNDTKINKKKNNISNYNKKSNDNIKKEAIRNSLPNFFI